MLHNRGADGKLRAIEAEAGRRFKPEMLKGLQVIAALSGVVRRILVSGGNDTWRTDDHIEVMSLPQLGAALGRGL